MLLALKRTIVHMAGAAAGARTDLRPYSRVHHRYRSIVPDSIVRYSTHEEKGEGRCSVHTGHSSPSAVRSAPERTTWQGWHGILFSSVHSACNVKAHLELGHVVRVQHVCERRKVCLQERRQHLRDRIPLQIRQKPAQQRRTSPTGITDRKGASAGRRRRECCCLFPRLRNGAGPWGIHV
jgi:hypothetical protein